MGRFPIGVLLESFQKPVLESLALARALNVSGIQVYATTGELSPSALSGGKAAAFLRMVNDHGLQISALCGDLGHGFGDASKNKALIEQSKRILDLAKALNTNIVTTHIGVVPAKGHPRYAVMQDACGELARYADSVSAHFAVETGPETAATLRSFLDELHSHGVAVNLDPANFVMVTGDDPVGAVHTLKDYIVHTHAKDGVKLLNRDPELIYGIRPGDALIVDDEAFREVPLGEGGVPFSAYLDALSEIGYKGYLTIEREVGEDPAGDIEKAVRFLEALG